MDRMSKGKTCIKETKLDRSPHAAEKQEPRKTTIKLALAGDKPIAEVALELKALPKPSHN